MAMRLYQVISVAVLVISSQINSSEAIKCLDCARNACDKPNKGSEVECPACKVCFSKSYGIVLRGCASRQPEPICFQNDPPNDDLDTCVCLTEMCNGELPECRLRNFKDKYCREGTKGEDSTSSTVSSSAKRLSFFN